MEGALAVVVLFFIGLLALLGYAVYFIFKIHQFVIQALNIYKKMLDRQDLTIKLLKDIRDRKTNSSVKSSKVQKDKAAPIVDNQGKECQQCNKQYPTNYDGKYCESCGGGIS